MMPRWSWRESIPQSASNENLRQNQERSRNIIRYQWVRDHIARPGPMHGGGASRGRLGMATVRPPYCTQCRTFRSTDQRGGFGTAFLPKIQ